MTPRRFALLLLALLIGWQIQAFEIAALPSILLAAAALVCVLAVEETRIKEARRDAKDARRRECRHGGTSFQPYDGDGTERGRS